MDCLCAQNLISYFDRYCECFASRQYCDGCNCVGCNNTVEYQEQVQKAVNSTLDRNPKAFRNKIEFNGGASIVSISHPFDTVDETKLIDEPSPYRVLLMHLLENTLKVAIAGKVIALKNIVNASKLISSAAKIVNVVIVKILMDPVKGERFYSQLAELAPVA